MPEEQRNVSRRTMLKRIGAAGAIAWSAPVLSSLSMKAHAQQGSLPCTGRDWNCGDPFSLCGTGGQGQVCLCDVDTSGNTVCWEDFGCGSQPACSSNADCTAPGTFCATTCCGQTCAPTCANPETANVALVGPSATGRTY